MADVLEILKKLPELCATFNMVDGEPIIIKRGVMGYYPAPQLKQHPVNADRGIGRTTIERVQAFNEAHNATPRHIAAMHAGSMFGWEIPAADIDLYDDDGKPVAAKVKALKA